jgi:xanthine/uracil/vitamin C permease (AzgA family)
MAEQAVTHHHGDMPVQAQASTYHGVMDLFKWGALAVAALLVLLTLWFCTPAGFVPGLVVAAILVILGVVFLRGGKSGAH